MMTRTAWASAALLLAAAGPAQTGLAQTGGVPSRIPVVVELFTSEGCSSCPPADRVLTRLDRDQPITGVEVIGLGEHVDYWNYEGWRDKFSSPLFTSRQQDYGQALRLASVYTPQVVVDGGAQVLGSDLDAVTRAIRSAALAPRAVVRLRVIGFDEVQVEVRALPQGVSAADMLLAVTENNLETAGVGGENGGRRLRHSAVVRSMTNLGRLDPKKDGFYAANARLNLRSEWNRQNLKLVLFVQDRSNRRIVGAAAARL